MSITPITTSGNAVVGRVVEYYSNSQVADVRSVVLAYALNDRGRFVLLVEPRSYYCAEKEAWVTPKKAAELETIDASSCKFSRIEAGEMPGSTYRKEG